MFKQQCYYHLVKRETTNSEFSGPRWSRFKGYKLIELVHKKPRETTDTQDANSLSSTEQSFQPSTLLQETDSGQCNFLTSTWWWESAKWSWNTIKFRNHCRYWGIKTRFIDPSETSSRKYKASVDVEYSKTRWKCLRRRAPRLQWRKCEKLLSTISKKDHAINDLKAEFCH